MNQVATKAPAPIVELRTDLQKMEKQFSTALPPHIPVERFTRVLMTAVQNNPDLLACSRQSFFNSAMKCAQDGLLPDGREAALVPFGQSGSREKQVSYLPMIAGIRKKVRNSGELVDWYAEVVHEGDEFDYQLGDDPHIHHKPALTGGRTRPVTHAYSVAVFPDGTKSREIMTVGEIEDVRKKYARAAGGPWSDPVAYPEMCRKTVARLHSKQLPMSTDLDRMIHRDDELYDFKAAREASQQVAGRRPDTIAAAFDHLGSGREIDGEPQQQQRQIDKPKQETAQDEQTLPKTVAEYKMYVSSTIKSTDDPQWLREWFSGEAQRKLRNACGLVREDFEFLNEAVNRHVAALEANQQNATDA